MSNLQLLDDAAIEVITGGAGAQFIGRAIIRQGNFGISSATATGGNGGGAFLGGGAGGGATAIAGNLQSNTVNVLAF